MRWMILLCCCWLAACAHVQPPAPLPDSTHLLHDEAFAAPAQRVDAGEVFALSDAMRHLLGNAPALPGKPVDPRDRLLELLFDQRRLTLDYDSTQTRNASQAFAARSGNCLSLVIMTAAFAKAAGLSVEYRQVLVEDAWTRSGDLLFASGHVQVALSWPGGRRAIVQRSQQDVLVIDFLPAEEMRGLRIRPIEEKTITAMFMNNRAAEALAHGAVDDAYWWAREAVAQDPGFLAAYNTLGVVYTKHGQPGWAQPVFEAVLAREPGNTKAIDNLVHALQADGRAAEAKPWAQRLAQLEPYPPFHFLQAGQAAAQQQDWRSARELFSKEAERQPYNPEVHFWLAQANYQLGNRREADKQLELARQNSTTPQDHALYAAKLGWLRAHAADTQQTTRQSTQ